MTIAGEIRKQIEKNKELKLAVGEINNHLSVLEELTRKDIMEQVDEAYQRGYDKGYADKTNNIEVCNKIAKDIQDEGYQRGLNDAWEAAKKLFSSMADSDIEKAFPIEWNNGGFNALINLQPQEAIAKLKAYEEKQKTDNCIEIGDEVKWDGNKCIVTNRHIDINMGIIQDYDLMSCEGSIVAHVKRCSFVKTGRHFDIDKILEEMRHD